MKFNEFLDFIGNEFDFDTEGVEENTTFADINFDEIDMIELVMSVEDKYHLEIPDEDLKKIVTIGDFVNFMDDKLQ